MDNLQLPLLTIGFFDVKYSSEYPWSFGVAKINLSITFSISDSAFAVFWHI